ncbi:MAG TPA: FAD-dependent monooxygenase [Chthoniobacterales bacterium]|nr:FAD-dependent monooxygenase [Chthoniobacterales bacterium]
MTKYDVVVVGGGPAGAVTAAITAEAGLRTLIIERAFFPRDKVCGDCLNPGCWEVFERLGVVAKIAALPSSRLEWVEFVNLRGVRIRRRLPQKEPGEVALRRRLLDDALLNRAKDLGVEIWHGEPVTGLSEGWHVQTETRAAQAKFLIAADGRNSSVARYLRHFPQAKTDRIAYQTHFPAKWEPHVALELWPEGYLGRQTVDQETVGICVVSRPALAEEFRLKIAKRFGLPSDHRWNSIAPLSRKPIRADHKRLFYVGDAARVVEPFTGEGILYALKSGLLAAETIKKAISSQTDYGEEYLEAHRRLYAGRLWINQLARWSVLHPRMSSNLVELFRIFPAPLHYLTQKVVG